MKSKRKRAAEIQKAVKEHDSAELAKLREKRKKLKLTHLLTKAQKVASEVKANAKASGKDGDASVAAKVCHHS